MNKKVLARPKRGHYSLATAQVQLLRNLDSTGSQEFNSIDIKGFDKIPDTIHEGKKVCPQRQ